MRRSLSIKRRASEYAVTVRYLAPPSGLVNALEGWAVDVRLEEGLGGVGIFRGDVPHWGKFRIEDTLDGHLVLGADLSEIKEVVVL